MSGTFEYEYEFQTKYLIINLTSKSTLSLESWLAVQLPGSQERLYSVNLVIQPGIFMTICSLPSEIV
jgi:hypothetical protein